MKGKFVVFEGIDGTGKGTLIQLVARQLEGLTDGHYHLTRQPGGSAAGEAVRDILFKTVKTANITDDATTLLFLASHANENEREIEPRLAKGITVVCDRWHATHLAYMAVRKNLTYPVAEVSFRLKTATPDLTILLVGDPKVLLARAQGRPGGEAGKQDAKIWNDVTLQTTIQDEFLKLVGSNPSTLVVDTTWAAPEWLFEHLIEPRVAKLFAPGPVEVLRSLAGRRNAVPTFACGYQEAKMFPPCKVPVAGEGQQCTRHRRIQVSHALPYGLSTARTQYGLQSFPSEPARGHGSGPLICGNVEKKGCLTVTCGNHRPCPKHHECNCHLHIVRPMMGEQRHLGTCPRYTEAA